MPVALKDVSILIPGSVHPRVIERVGKEFDLVRIDEPDADLLSEEQLAAIRGIACLALISPPLIDRLPNLEIVSNFGVGYDLVDAPYCADKGIMVTHTPDILTEEVADTAIALLLNTAREFPRAEAWLRSGKWESEGDYPFTRGTLRGRHVGIFGMGRIGQAIGRRLAAMDLKVSYHNRRPVEGSEFDYYASLKELAEAVDTIVSVAPGGEATDKVVNGEILKALGPDGIFINIGRGSTVDEDDLIAALSDGTIMAAGLDVFAEEPRVRRELIEMENTSLLPHVGSMSVKTRNAMADLVVDNLVDWFSAKPAITPVPETRKLNRS